MTRQIIRIDKGDGTKSVEPDDHLVRKTVNECYPPYIREKVLADFFNGERQISNQFAIYETREAKAEGQ